MLAPMLPNEKLNVFKYTNFSNKNRIWPLPQITLLYVGCPQMTSHTFKDVIGFPYLTFFNTVSQR